MARKFRPSLGVVGPLAVAISCCQPPLLAAAADTIPALGTDAETIQQYDATVEDAARPLRWNLSFMKYDQSLNTRMFDGLVQRGVTHIVVTVGLEHSLADIAGGKLDGDLKKISAEMNQWRQNNPHVQIIVRPFHEMNGDWYPWGFKNGHNGNSVSQFNPAWRHVRSVMRSSFPDLPFMWCANVNQDDHFIGYYPGNDQVEYLAFDGYNHSTSRGGWETMEQIFHKSLVALRSTPGIDRSKPLVVAETATTEPNAAAAAVGHSKAEWFGNSYGNMGWWLHNEAPKFGISTVLYFNYPDLFTGKSLAPEAYKNDYLIFDPKLSNAPESRAVFRASVRDLS
jgi:glycosyl hydrolase family 26